jgi:hypothetical protein
MDCMCKKELYTKWPAKNDLVGEKLLEETDMIDMLKEKYEKYDESDDGDDSFLEKLNRKETKEPPVKNEKEFLDSMRVPNSTEDNDVESESEKLYKIKKIESIKEKLRQLK